jgi:predicted outer membrane repeat protein
MNFFQLINLTGCQSKSFHSPTIGKRPIKSLLFNENMVFLFRISINTPHEVIPFFIDIECHKPYTVKILVSFCWRKKVLKKLNSIYQVVRNFIRNQEGKKMTSLVQFKIKKSRFFIHFLHLFICCLFILSNSAKARDLFYVLDSKGSFPDYEYYLKCYDLAGVYQYEFFLCDPASGDDYGAVATDGYTAWILSVDTDTIDAFAIRAGGAVGSFFLQDSAGGAGGLALAGSSLYASRSLTWGAPTGVIQIYSTGGSYINTWNTRAADGLYPSSLQYVGGNALIAQNLVTADVCFLDMSNDGDVYASFVTNESTSRGLCANATTVWIKTAPSMVAYDYAGTRQPSLDAFFTGTTPARPLDVYYAWGPDEGVVSVSPMSIDFASIPEGSSTQQVIQIKNIGNINLTITGVSLSDTTNYSASTITLPYTLTPGQSIYPVITFTPQSIGTFDAEYSIQTSDGYPTETTVSLHGTGVNALWYVDFEASPGGDGTSWATAFSSINEAMADSGVLDGSEIRVLADGTNQGQTISKSVSIYGAYNISDQRNLENKTEIGTGGSGRNVQISAPDVRLDGFLLCDGMADYGAGLKIDSSNVTVANCDIEDNIATFYGGGVHLSTAASAITFTDCLIKYNESRFGGGGIYDQSDLALTLDNCEIIYNISNEDYGGGLCDGRSAGSITMTQCTIINNKCRGMGAGSYSSSPIYLTNCLIADNSSNYGTTDPQDSRGAGMYLQGRAELTNCTVATNKRLSDSPYGGAGICSGSADPLIVTNCIVWGNSDINGNLQGQQISTSSGTATVTYTDIQDNNFLGNNNINQDPLFANPDGFDDDPENFYDNDYHLQVSSPCKDTATATGAPSNDLDGVARPLDGGYDRGAYEYIYRHPGPWYVDGSIGTSGDGTSWLSAFQTIQEALTVAASGHEIWIKQGTYSLYRELDWLVFLYGGFDGTETLRSQRDWENNPTIIDGGGSEGGAYVNADIILDGLTFQNCAEGSGPALFIEGCDPTISNCTFQYNQADEFGGAVYNYHTMAEYTNCTFLQNSAGDSGGAICNEEAVPVFRDCTIKYNQAPSLGGGVYNMYANAVFENCVISGNKATDPGTDGGGMTNDWSDPVLTNCLVVGNWAAVGGGISNYKSDLTIQNCTIANNRAIETGGDGGGVGGYDAIITVIDSILWGNEAAVLKEIGLAGESTVNVQYSNVDQDGFAGDDGNMRQDPLFAAPGFWNDNGTPTDPNDDIWNAGDYHLMSTAGRWNPDILNWVNDASTSRCIDAGNPGSLLGDELADPDNLRINMGAYGGTEEASLPPHGWALLSDVNNDGISNLTDLEATALDWLSTDENLSSDFNRDGVINFEDMALLAQDYLEQTSWY